MAITNAALAQQISELVSYWRARDVQFAEWLAGDANGGPYGDGRYPLTDYLGVVKYVHCPAALEAGVSNSAAAAAVQAALAGESKDAALAAQAAAEAARDLAIVYRNEARSARDLALNYRNDAAASAASALAYRNTAVSASSSAQAAQSAAESAQGAAEAARDAAQGYAADAAQSAADAAASAAAAATFDPANFYTKAQADGLFALLGHTHDAADIVSGTLDSERIPNLAASKITSGTLSDSRLSANIPRLNVANTFSAVQTVQVSGATPLAVRRVGNSQNVNIEFGHDGATRYLGLDAAGNLRVGASANLNVSGTKLVLDDDPRLSDARTPVAHTHAAADIVSGILSKSLVRVVNVVDTRAVNDPVSNFASGVQFDFKNRDTVSLPSGGGYAHAALMTISPWNDDTGGVTHQLAFDGSGRLFHRIGSRAGGWNSWTHLLEGRITSNAAELVLQDANAVNRVRLYGNAEGFGFLDGAGVWTIRSSSGYRFINNNDSRFPYGTYWIYGAVNGYTGLILDDGAHYPTFMSDASWIGVYCQFGGRGWLWADDGAGILLRGKVRQYGSGRAYLLSNYDSANVTISTSGPSGGNDGDIWLQVL